MDPKKLGPLGLAALGALGVVGLGVVAGDSYRRANQEHTGETVVNHKGTGVLVSVGEPYEMVAVEDAEVTGQLTQMVVDVTVNFGNIDYTVQVPAHMASLYDVEDRPEVDIQYRSIVIPGAEPLIIVDQVSPPGTPA